MRASALAAAVLLATSGTTAAWVTPTGNDTTVVGAAGLEPRGARVLDPARDAPAGWRGTRDRDTGVVAQLWGGYVAVPGAVRDPAIAEAAARAFVAQHVSLLAPGVAPADLVTIANQVDRKTAGGTLRTVAFQQTWRGLRVVGGQLHVVFGNDRLFAVGSQIVPGVAPAVPPRGAVQVARAQAWVTAQTGRATTARATGERVVLPIVRGRGDVVVRIADVVDVRATGSPERWDVYVAPDGTPLLREARVRSADGTLAYDAGVRRPTGARQGFPVAATGITVDGAPATTSAVGGFTWAGGNPATVIPGLAGQAVRILDEAGALATAQLVAPPGGTVTWSLASDEAGDAQLSAYVHVALAKARARQLAPQLASWLDQPLDVHVNASGACNALSTGDALYFFRGSAACENTARLADVVYHELGHALHLHGIIPGAGAYQGALSEGLSDFFAAHLVDDQGVGRGFTFDDVPVREVDPPGFERVWPDDREPSVHLTGLIVAGALWDLRKVLVAELGEAPGLAAAEAIYLGVLQRSPDIPSSYLAALVADDDDGDLGNGTPHQCAIETAFGKHGLAGPEFRTTTVGVPAVDGLALAVPVDVPAGTTCPPPQVTRVEVAWRTGDGPASTFELTPTATATGATFTGTLPAQPAPALVRYTVTAYLDDQSSVRYPRNAADPEYQLYAGEIDEIWCERLDADPAWAQLGAAGWEWAMPAATAPSGDPTMAFTGTHALGQALGGTGRYATSATSAIETPVIDVASYDQVRLHYRRWLTVEDALYDRATIAINGTPVWTNAETAAGQLPHLDREWRFHDVDLTPHAGGTIQLRWELASDASREYGGWTLDDVCLVGLGKHARCGDGVLDDGELCDDGNAAGGDGCDDACALEDDGGCCSTGGDPIGPLGLGAGVLALVSRRRSRTRRARG